MFNGGIDIGAFIKEFERLASSKDPTVRHEAYTLLHEKAIYLHGRLAPDQVSHLVQIVHREKDPELARLGLEGLIGIALVTGTAGGWDPEPEPDEEFLDTDKEPVKLRGKRGTLLLGEALWKPFLQESAVFVLRDPDMYVRDETAESYLCRRLSFDGYGQADFHHILTSEHRAHFLLGERPFHAVCAVGRPGLFGPVFRSMILCQRKANGLDVGPDEEGTRYGFEVHERPLGLPRHGIDPDRYHYLIERKGDGTIVRYETDDDGKRRIDFGLVQRYPIEICGQKVIVVVCAGNSSLGTFGAAKWASRVLFPNPKKPIEGPPIPAPDRFGPGSRLEALLRVTADSTRGVWESPNIKVERLLADSDQWSAAEKKWLPAAPDEITVCYSGKEPIDIHFDGARRDYKLNSTMFNLTAALVERALAGTPELTLPELRAMTSIWRDKDGEPIKATDGVVSTQLTTLRQRHLGDALRVDGRGVSLLCKVRRV